MKPIATLFVGLVIVAVAQYSHAAMVEWADFGNMAPPLVDLFRLPTEGSALMSITLHGQ